MSALYIRFTQGFPQPLKQRVVGRSLIDSTGDTLCLINSDAQEESYTNAQIDDYTGERRRAFRWRPPLRLTVRARFSHAGAHENHNHEPLVGTAGFGFWNDPFALMDLRMPALPRAIWFFYASPPSNMALAIDTPGWGWKAATIDAATLPFVLLAPTAPLAMPLMNISPLYRLLWPVGQWAIKVNEQRISSPMADWHIYHIDWGTRIAHFSIDGQSILTCNTPPQGPMGLVIWIDNQYMQITPQGRIRHGYLAKPGRQWLAVDWLAIEQGRPDLGN